MLSKVIFVLFIFWTVSLGQENILLNKPSFSNDYTKYKHQSNDGSIDKCMWLRSKPIVYVGFDLEAIHKIDKIVIRNGGNRGSQKFQVMIGNLDPCRVEQYMSKLTACSTTEVQKTDSNEVSCNGQMGRYILIVRGDFKSNVNVDKFDFCEIEAYGVKTGNDILAKVENQPVPKVDRTYFRHLNALRKHLPVATVAGRNRGFVKLNKDCEPFIWDSTWNLTFALACSSNNGKTRALLFSSEWYYWFATHKKENKHFGDDFIKWLSPNSTNPTYYSTYYKSFTYIKNNIKQGDIFDVFTYMKYTESEINQILKWHDEGFVSLVIDHTRNIEAEDVLAKRLFAHFNVIYDDVHFLYRGVKTYTMEDKDFNEMIMDPEDIIGKMTLNYDYLIKYYKPFITIFSKLTPQLFEKSKSFEEKVYKLLIKYNKYIDSICPCKIRPNSNPEQQSFLNMIAALAKSQFLAKFNYKLPCIDIFPGDFKTPPTKITQIIEIFGDVVGTRNPTGLYIAAGQPAKYKVLESNNGSWTFEIGCQSDSLMGKRPNMLRYPYIYDYKIVIKKSGTLHSPFGGAIWISNHQKQSKLRIQIENVVQTPFFNIQNGEKAVTDWDNIMRPKAEGLWSQLAGQDYVTCGKSKELKKFNGKEIQDVLKLWDKVIRHTRVLSNENWRDIKPEAVVVDCQTSVGSAHSGYPIVLWDDWYTHAYNYSYIMKEGSWGMVHEIGHNRQESVWTFNGVGETTNNVYCLYIYKRLFKLPYRGSSKAATSQSLINKVTNYLNDGAPYSKWTKMYFVSLMTYAQLVNHCEFGVWHETLKYYKDHPNEFKWIKTDDDERNAWVNVTSKITGMNLGPFYEFWGWPISDSFHTKLEKYGKCFLPDDFFMDLSETRKNYILKKYPNCVRKSLYYRKTYFDNLIVGDRPNFFKKIE